MIRRNRTRIAAEDNLGLRSGLGFKEKKRKQSDCKRLAQLRSRKLLSLLPKLLPQEQIQPLLPGSIYTILLS